MTFLGQSAITAPTRTTARALLVTAALLAMIRLGWVTVDDLTVFEATLTESRAEATLRWLAAFLVLAHGVQWLGDFLGYRADPSLFGVEHHAAHLDQYLGIQRSNPFSRPRSAPNPPTATAACPAASGLAVTRLPPVLRFWTAFYAAFYVWVWYLALPILAALGALLWSLHG